MLTDFSKRNLLDTLRNKLLMKEVWNSVSIW